ncbi:pectinesterase family protein [Niastella sp. OAS944]|uniref:pectinesterase family protein n=1 Tax=Niastella sp. OAS944 TaxID=2664089 RepID=UPI003478682E|nr:pectin methylesterase-like acyl-CoA thioesterase [Chitinophagaceae bacterium OAS944]
MLYQKNRYFFCCLLTMLALIRSYGSHAQQPAFPGAEGAGMYTTGGRGTAGVPTTVFEVTNLLDDGLPGSLRYALSANATYRTVVFRVSGTIHLTSRLTIKANTTIAGQTAPGDGICIADHNVSISGDNVIVRYIRFRLGDRYQKKTDANGNPVDGSGGDDAFGALGPSNIIIDHVTASWSSDEVLTIYRGDNLTIQWSLISEPLNYSYHFETGDTDYENHGYGGIWGAKRGSMHHNLIAHCRNRNPRFAGISTYTPNTIGVENVDFRNNVLYNWGINTVYGGEGGNYNIVNNYYKYGPNTGSGVRYRICNPSNSATVPVGKWYVDGNYVDGSPTNTANNWAGVSAADPAAAMAAVPLNHGYPVTTETAVSAFETVLLKAGCSLPNRDTLDQRIVNDVRNRSGRIIDVQGGFPHGTDYALTVNAWPALVSTTAPSDNDHDGMPDSYETANGLNPADAADRNGYAANGYTNLENYLNSLTNTTAGTTPFIYANATFNTFNQITGAPSPAQNFPVSGSNLSGAITITAPAGYQLSTDGTNWSGSITLNPINSVVASTNIQVRLNAATAGSYTGQITIQSPNATTLQFALNGTTANVTINQKQLIGLFPTMEGGFENQAAGTLSTAAPAAATNLMQTVWTTNGSGNIINNGTARTGSNYFTYTSTSGSTKNVYSPTVTTPNMAKSTKYIVQYYYRTATPATGNSVSGLLAVADSINFTTNYNTIAYAGTGTAWAKAALSYSVNPAYNPTYTWGGLRFNGGGAAIVKPFDVDDLVIYAADDQANPSADNSAPDAATSPAAATGTNGSINISWAAPATGVDGGGYVVVRSTSTIQPALNANGIYSIGNNIGNSIVLYIGTATNFTDDGSLAALKSDSTYNYFIFTGDKAFNYSTPVVASATVMVTPPTDPPTPPTYEVKVYTANNADAVVALDGSGNYSSVQAAIDAAPTGRTTPYVIFVKNGKYIEKVRIPSNKPFIHLIGESVANTIISWDSYSGKVEGGVVIGTNTSATLTVNANDFYMMSITVENSTGYTGDGPQALAMYISGDRCAYKNCRLISGQDTLWHNGDGRHYFKSCYIDGNTDFIFGSSTAVFDSCVIFPRDRIDGSGGGYVTAGATSASNPYGEVFRNCILTGNRGVTTYSLGRPWQNAPKTVFLNTIMGSSINPTGWSTWNIDTSLITYAEYNSRNYNGTPVDVSKRLSWSKQLSDTAAARYYNNVNLFREWDPFLTFPAINAPVTTELAVSNMRTQRSGAKSIISWNISWPMTGVTYDLMRSTDSIHFTKIAELTGTIDSIVAFSTTDALPAKGSKYYYYVKASKPSYPSTNSYVAIVDPTIPINGEFRSMASGNWTNNGTTSIWERYNSSTKAWETVAVGTGASGTVTISTGDTVTLNALVGINNLSIDSGAVFQTDASGRNLRIKGDINNAGTFGGTSTGTNKITLELDGANGEYNITGSGLFNFSGIRALTGVKNITLNINADVTLNGNLQAWYGSASATNYGDNNVIINVGKGYTVKANVLHSSSTTNTAASFGKYTYNINGTLDLSNSTALSGLIPHATASGNSIALNVNGLLKTGTQFRTGSTGSGIPETKVLLHIGDSGWVDASKASAFAIIGNYFVVNGNGRLTLPVGLEATLFPIATAAGLYSPVSLKNNGTPDNFTVNIKNSFDHPVTDTTKVVNNQWTITEETPGGSDITAVFGWETASQASAFDTAQLLAVMQYDSAWKIKRTILGGSGSHVDPFTATVSGLKNFSIFGVTNYTKANASVQVKNLTHTYDGLTHEATAFAYGTGGVTDTLTPAVTLNYADQLNNILPGLPRNAGAYSVIVNYTGNDYYNPDTAVYSLTIIPAPLTIKAVDQEKEFRAAIDLGNTKFITSGLATGDTITSVSLYSAGAGAKAKMGVYPIIPSNATGSGLANYVISYQNGTLTVNPPGCGNNDHPFPSHDRVKIYPNPADDFFIVHVNKPEPNATIQLYTSNGGLIRTVRFTSEAQRIWVKDLHRGIYYVVIKNGRQVTTEKLIIR